MTKEQALQLMRFYSRRLASYYNHCTLDGIPNTKHRHLIQMHKRVKPEFSAEKTMRWLGFMQGVLWQDNWYSLEELKEHSRQAEKDVYAT